MSTLLPATDDLYQAIVDRDETRKRSSRLVVMTRILTPLGPMVAAAAPEGLCLLEFDDRRQLDAQLARLRERLDCTLAPGDSEHLTLVRDELERYFAGALRAFTVPVIAPGTEFQEAVWARLRQIPYGQTASYEQMARDIGRVGAQRAVGRANGDNRLAIVFPCHRVVRSDGKLCGYAGGLWRKQFLLELEGAVAGTSRAAGTGG